MRGLYKKYVLIVVMTGIIFASLCAQTSAVSEKLDLTQEELACLETQDTLKVGYVTDRIPVSFQNEEGELDGISRKIFDRIQEISGLSFEYVPLPQGSVTYDYLRGEGFDLVTSVEFNDANKNSRGILLSNPYLTSKKVIVGKKDLLFSQSASLQIAISTGSQTLTKVLAEQYPNFEIVNYGSIEDCFAAVSKGEADVTLQNQFVAEHWLARARYENLKVIPVIGWDDQMCFSAVGPIGEPDSEEWVEKGKIVSILDKSIALLDPDELTNYVIEATMENQYDSDLSDFAYRYRYGIVIFFIGLVLVTVLAVLMIVFYLKEVAARADMKAQRNFLSSMSHEIRTPLNGMMGLNQLMAQNLGDIEKMDSYVKQSSLVTRYLLSLVNDILDMSELQEDHIQIVKNPFSLPLTMTMVEAIEKNYMEQKNIRFCVETEIQYPRLVGDAIHIQQVLFNLLDNARKFTPEQGEVTVKLRQEKIGSDRVFTRVEVADTGCGMSEEFQKKIFDSFTRESDTVSKGNQGTGLGMAISYRLAKLMDGDLSVSSTPGKGSQFVFTFLTVLPREESKAETGRDAGAPDRTDADGEDKIHVLVAEDNELNAEILTELLREAGYLVSHAENGQKAVDLFAASEPGWFSYILMDLLMPEKDGFEAARAIRALDRQDAATVKIFACTANAFQEDRQKAMESGMDGFIAKPVDVNVLLKMLKGTPEESGE